MPRTTNAASRAVKRAKVFAMTKGFRGKRKNCYSIAVRAAERAMQNAYVGRKEKKRNIRQAFISRISAAARENGTSYSRLMHDMTTSDIQLNRKVLSELAIHEPKSFSALTKFSQERAQEVRKGLALI
eukprot:m.337063 g.337063  ORF g.337063 m.337063 type:complete len:128 (-) comp18036_c0_seq1:176-559(-)